jgi:hypothetical protein
MERVPIFQSHESFKNPELERLSKSLMSLDYARMYNGKPLVGRDTGDEHPDPKDPVHNRISPEQFQNQYASLLRETGHNISLEKKFSEEFTSQTEILLTLDDHKQLQQWVESFQLPLTNAKDREALAILLQESLATFFSSVPGTGRDEYFYDMIPAIRPLAEITKQCAGEVYKDGDKLATTAYQIHELIRPLDQGYLNEYIEARELHFFDLEYVADWCKHLSLEEYRNRLESMYTFIVNLQKKQPLFADTLSLNMIRALEKVKDLGNASFPTYPDSFRRSSAEYATSLGKILVPQESFTLDQNNF